MRHTCKPQLVLLLHTAKKLVLSEFVLIDVRHRAKSKHGLTVSANNQLTTDIIATQTYF